MKVTAQGRVVGVVNNPYDFEDQQTGDRRTGTSRRLYLSTAFTEEPTTVNVKASDPIACGDFDRFCGDVGYLDLVDVVCSVKNGRTMFVSASVVEAFVSPDGSAEKTKAAAAR